MLLFFIKLMQSLKNPLSGVIRTSLCRCKLSPRDAMHAHYLSAGVCLSVCLSVTLMYCIQTAKVIVKFLLRLITPHSNFLRPSSIIQF